MGINWTDLSKWLVVAPIATTWIDLIAWAHIWHTIWNVIWATEAVLQWGNSLLNPLFQSATWLSQIWFSTILWWVSAWLLTNTILNDLWIEKKWVKYSLNTAATLAGFAWWSVLAPYLVAGWLSYAIWKHGWKYWKIAVKSLVWCAWWLTAWAVAWWARSAWKWMKWEQWINPRF